MGKGRDMPQKNPHIHFDFAEIRSKKTPTGRNLRYTAGHNAGIQQRRRSKSRTAYYSKCYFTYSGHQCQAQLRNFRVRFVENFVTVDKWGKAGICPWPRQDFQRTCLQGAAPATTPLEMLQIFRTYRENPTFFQRGVEGAAPYDRKTTRGRMSPGGCWFLGFFIYLQGSAYIYHQYLHISKTVI